MPGLFFLGQAGGLGPSSQPSSRPFFVSTRRATPGLDQRVSRQGVFFRFWLPVLLWAALIFWGSTDLLSDRQTSRFLGPILRWLLPGLSDAAVSWAQYGVRKAGHLMEYAILAALIYRALRGSSQTQEWLWRRAAWAFAATVLYAVSDEWHQAIVATRYGSGWDVLIDAVGAVLGLAGFWIFERVRTRR